MGKSEGLTKIKIVLPIKSADLNIAGMRLTDKQVVNVGNAPRQLPPSIALTLIRRGLAVRKTPASLEGKHGRSR